MPFLLSSAAGKDLSLESPCMTCLARVLTTILNGLAHSSYLMWSSVYLFRHCCSYIPTVALCPASCNTSFHLIIKKNGLQTALLAHRSLRQCQTFGNRQLAASALDTWHSYSVVICYYISSVFPFQYPFLKKIISCGMNTYNKPGCRVSA